MSVYTYYSLPGTIAIATAITIIIIVILMCFQNDQIEIDAIKCNFLFRTLVRSFSPNTQTRSNSHSPKII